MNGTTNPRWMALALAASLLFACKGESPAKQESPTSEAPAVETTTEAKAEPAGEPEAAKTDACAPIAELNAMDNRKPVPLQPMMAWHQKQNMMEHLVAIQRINAGLVDDNWEEIAKASSLIESSPQMQMMCQHMGAGAEGFTDLALEFHKRADAIGAAAKAKDAKGVLKATAHTLEACTSCHATYRQDVVDAQTWQALTGSEHKPNMMHHGH